MMPDGESRDDPVCDDADLGGRRAHRSRNHSSVLQRVQPSPGRWSRRPRSSRGVRGIQIIGRLAMKGAAAILIAAVIVGAVIAFQLGIISLPRAGQSTPTESYTTEIKSVDDGGHADSVLVSTHSAQLGGTEAQFAAEVGVDIVLQITEASGSTIA